MDVCFVINEQYVQHTGACITSLLYNQATQDLINIHILHSSVTAQSQRRLKKLEKHYHCHIEFYNVQDKDLSHFVIKGPEHITIEMYYKLFIPTVLKDIDKVLYLDVDTIVTNDLTELWQTNLNGNYAGVSFDFHIHTSVAHLNNLNIDGAYFNSGMMLLNLKLLRSFSLIDRSVEALKQFSESIRYPDQDVLNIVFKGRCAWVKPSFNLTNFTFDVYSNTQTTAAKAALNRFFPEETWGNLEHYKKAPPHIIHFNGPTKPWHFECEHVYKELYFYYLKKYLSTVAYYNVRVPFIIKRISLITKCISLITIKRILFFILGEKRCRRIKKLFIKNK